MLDKPYRSYIDSINAKKTHNGYFSIDKKTSRLVDPEVKARSTEAEDVDAYDLILKDKERLLSLDEPVRFIFSHSALSEGWDNPNVFVICTLKHSDSNIRKRQEVGRGMRLCVNQAGDRIDSGANIHDINLLTVVASESYKDFTAGLQKEISESLSDRPRKADEAYFTGKIIKTEEGTTIAISPQMAKQIYKYLLKNDYTDDSDSIAPAYHDAKKNNTLAPLPSELVPYAGQVMQLIDSVFSDAALPVPEDGRKGKQNPLNQNIEKAEFKALWDRINQKAAYTVHFDSAELIRKCITALGDLHVTKLQYTVMVGEQTASVSFDEMKSGEGFKVTSNSTEEEKISVHSAVKYDLIGRLAEDTQLTRRTIAEILQHMNNVVFMQYRHNPEDFMMKTAQIINEQKATMIIEHLTYSPVDDRHELQKIFTVDKQNDFSRAVKTERHVYDYVFTDSKNERAFVTELDKSTEVVVYAKLPKGFFIPTPVGNYNPDWAIAFEKGKVKHIYFVAETKGSMSSLELRKIEECKIGCARKFFAGIATDKVKYDVVSDYAKLMNIVK